MKKWKLLLLDAVLLAALLLSACQLKDVYVPEETTTAPTAEATEPTATEPVPEPVVPTWVVLEEDYQVTCREYFVYDVTAGTFVDSSGDPATTRIYPASITKLFTAYVAMQYLEPDTLVTVGPEITLIDPDSTTAGLEQGDVLEAKLLVGGMLLPSGNDAAYAIAAAAGRVILDDPNCSAWTAVDAFVEEMNSQAAALGMTGSHFRNPDGIHQDDHYLSLTDMAKVGQLSLENELVMDYAGTGLETVQIGDRTETWKNTNALIRSDIPYMSDEELALIPNIDPLVYRELYCEYAIGLKTGRTTPAGCCLLSAFQVQGRTLIIGVFGSQEGEHRFSDTLHLFNQALEIL